MNTRFLWIPLVVGSSLLALPGNSTIQGFLGDVLGHFFSAGLLALVPIAGYRILNNSIGEKEITYIFVLAWTYLVISQILNF